MALVLTCGGLSAPGVTSINTQTTFVPALEKRYKDVVVNKEYKKLQDMKNGKVYTTEIPKPWIRTIYGDKVEIVTPTVIAGVTISAKPPVLTDDLEPWVSLNGDGSPKTIRPKMKNGVIKNKSPDYSTWFQDVKTVTYSHEELRAHNMDEDEIFVEETFVPEDLTYRLLNPIVRCTPDLYKMKGMAKDQSPEPFCFPHDNARLYMDSTYFVTWYYKFFDPSVERVRLHLSYVKESIRQKGMKRDISDIEGSADRSAPQKRSSVMQKGGKLHLASFYVSDWLLKEEGILPLTILPDWFDEGAYYHKVLMLFQQDTGADDEFNHLNNFVVFEIAKKAKVAKGHYTDLAKQKEITEMRAIHGDDIDIEEGLNFDAYITMITLPTCVLVAALVMYLLMVYNRRQYDLSFLKKVKFNRSKHPRKAAYTELPQWDSPKID
ncbi:hypothetical protein METBISCDRAFT_14147 [Metschnikowia bicuspidata]|uniref:Uncharacterized protein n=1 Tax=Metschnikowia bicuspidata TaxID=27322 RepID=A0A4V1J3A9_9ASCO|nr:hypothetical protein METBISCDRAFT_14147 [Metschnikowia bicuspidata]